MCAQFALPFCTLGRRRPEGARERRSLPCHTSSITGARLLQRSKLTHQDVVQSCQKLPIRHVRPSHRATPDLVLALEWQGKEFFVVIGRAVVVVCWETSFDHQVLEASIHADLLIIVTRGNTGSAVIIRWSVVHIAPGMCISWSLSVPVHRTLTRMVDFCQEPHLHIWIRAPSDTPTTVAYKVSIAHQTNNNINSNTIWGGSVLTGEEPPPHSGELKHALSQAGGPTQSQLSRPMSSRHHISMEHRLRRKHL